MLRQSTKKILPYPLREIVADFAVEMSLFHVAAWLKAFIEAIDRIFNKRDSVTANRCKIETSLVKKA